MIIFCGCARKWTDKDRSEFISGCVSRSIPDMGEDSARNYCRCMLTKVEKKYPNARDAAYIRYDSSIVRIAKDCLKQP